MLTHMHTCAQTHMYTHHSYLYTPHPSLWLQKYGEIRKNALWQDGPEKWFVLRGRGRIEVGKLDGDHKSTNPVT